MVREEETGKQWESNAGAIIRKEARIGSEEYRKKGVTTFRLARVTGKLLFPVHKSMKQSLHYFFFGFCVLIYRTVQCEDACIVVSVCRFSRQFRHLLSAYLIVQWLLKACSNIPSYTRSHRMPRYTTRRCGAIQCISWNSREATLFGRDLDLSQRFCIELLQNDLNRPFYSCLLSGLWMTARLEVTLFWYRPHCLCVNQVVLMLTSWHLNEKSRKVCIKARSPSASLALMAR